MIGPEGRGRRRRGDRPRHHRAQGVRVTAAASWPITTCSRGSSTAGASSRSSPTRSSSANRYGPGRRGPDPRPRQLQGDQRQRSGHGAGDDDGPGRESRCSHGRLRSSDVLARLGGDEFAVLLAARPTRRTPRRWPPTCSSCCASHPSSSAGRQCPGHDQRRRGAVRARRGAGLRGAPGERRHGDVSGQGGGSRPAGDLLAARLEREALIEERLSWSERVRERARANDGIEPLTAADHGSRAPGRSPSARSLVRLNSEDGQLIPPGAFLGAAERSGLVDRARPLGGRARRSS